MSYLGNSYLIDDNDQAYRTSLFGEAMDYYYDHPYEFVCDVILRSADTQEYPSNQQTKVLKDIGNGKKHISIKSGHGIGKTAMISWIVIWFMTTRPHCKIPCTAPTQAQLFDVLWPELQKWINKIKDDRIKNNFIWTRTHLYNKNNPETWFAVARSSNKAENMQGFHADELLFIIDEASGVPQEIMEVVQGALTNEGAMCVMTGNPTQLQGTFYDSFYKDRQYWSIYTFSCVDSDIVSNEYVERMKGKYGEDTNIYKIRVLGEFPTEEDDTIIPMPWAMSAVTNESIYDAKQPVYIGVDVARFGNDKTIITIRSGNKVLSLKQYTKKSTMETVGNIMLDINNYIEKAPKIIVNIDDTGVGGGVTDRLRELMGRNEKVSINGINNGSRAFHEAKYVNLGTELWFNMKDNIREWDIPDDEELIAQLTTRRYKINSNGKLMLESKDDMKKRGLDSPDKADSLSLAFLDTAQKRGFVLV